MTTPDRYTCEQMFRKLDSYLDRTLCEDELRQVKAHLEECSVCAGEYRFEQSLLDDVRSKLRRIDLPSDLMGRLSARLAAAGDEGLCPPDD